MSMDIIARRVEGPIQGGDHGRPFGASPLDLAELGYVEEEYFFSGDAVAYAPVGELGPDGRWKTEKADSEPFVSRLLVRRPIDPDRFNGWVIAEWTNVTSGYEIAAGDVRGTYEAGYAHVAISAQDIGINGFAADPQGLRAWDPSRYDALTHPGDSHSFDIFTQGVHHVGPNRGDTGPDPMGGLHVRHVLATGGSQSAMRLVTYANAVMPHGHEVDAILATLYVGSAYTFTDARVDANNLLTATPEELAAILGTPTGIRDDVAVPFFIVNTECESVTYRGVRQEDSPRFRYWELTGAAHAPGPTLRDMADAAIREFGEFAISDGLVDPNLLPSAIDWRPVQLAAYEHIRRWVEDGTPPPSQPKIEIDQVQGIRRDEYGNALGGARLPDVSAPIGSHNGGGVTPGTLGLSGRTEWFGADVLRRLYADQDAYVAAVDAAARQAVRDGLIMEAQADAYVREAREASLWA